jgi:hypothetical protein
MASGPNQLYLGVLKLHEDGGDAMLWLILRQRQLPPTTAPSSCTAGAETLAPKMFL